MRPALEVADIFRRHGEAFRIRQGHRLSGEQRRVMAAIEACRTAALGGHVEQCEGCRAVRIAYNSCRNRHCPKCQGLSRLQWLADRRAELLPVAYFHLVFTLPVPIAAIALQNKAVVYDILFKAAAATVSTIGADPRHLGAETGMIAVLHTWGQSLQHHPHIHCIVPGGGLRPDGSWIDCRPGFFLPVHVMSRFYRRLFLDRLEAAYHDGRLQLSGTLAALSDPATFAAHLAPLRRSPWLVYAKRPLCAPDKVIEYLARYTHRVAIANGRLLTDENGHIGFRWRDYRTGSKVKVMTLAADEFIRRFLIHVLPKGFRRIRHLGFMANGCRAIKIAKVRAALKAPPPEPVPEPADYRERYVRLTGSHIDVCPGCGGVMRERWTWPRDQHRPQSPAPRCDTS